MAEVEPGGLDEDERVVLKLIRYDAALCLRLGHHQSIRVTRFDSLSRFQAGWTAIANVTTWEAHASGNDSGTESELFDHQNRHREWSMRQELGEGRRRRKHATLVRPGSVPGAL